MVLAVLDIVRDAMNLINAIGTDETPTNSEVQLGIRSLNIMIDRWSAEHLMLRSSTLDILALIPNQFSYTIGNSISANFNTAKPIRLIGAFIRDPNGTDTPLDIISQLTLDTNADDKDFTYGRPSVIAYDPGTSQQVSPNLGTIFVYTAPDLAYNLYLQSDKYMTEFVNPSDTITFEPAYYEALMYNLAVRLFRFYHTDNKQVPADLVGLAHSSKNILESMNAVQWTASCDIPGKFAPFNIYTGQ